MVLARIRLFMGTAMVFGKPAPFVSAFVTAVDEAMRAQSPSHGMPTMQRAWLAFCITAVLVTSTPSAGHALNVPASAAMRWRLCPGCFAIARCPGTVSRRVCGSSCATMACTLGASSLTIRTTNAPKRPKRSAYLYKLHDKESGGCVWGQSLVFLVLVTPKISIPVGCLYQPAPELSAWYKKDKALKKQGVP